MTTNRSGDAAVAAALGLSGSGPWPQSHIVPSADDCISGELAAVSPKKSRVEGRDRDRDRDGARGKDRDKYD